MSGSTLALMITLMVSCVVSWRAHITSRCQERALELLSARGVARHAHGETRALNTLLSVGTLSLNTCAWSGEVELKWRGYVTTRRGSDVEPETGLDVELDVDSGAEELTVVDQPKTLYIQTLSSPKMSASANGASVTVNSKRTLARWRYVSEGRQGKEWRPLAQLFNLPLSSVAR